jgi:hypothetical protein
MTGLDRTFSKATLEEKKDRRNMHQELRKRFTTALADIASVKNVSSTNHSDPHAALQDLQQVLGFSSIPKQYKLRKVQHGANGTQAESVVKLCMRNEAYDGVVSQRSASGAHHGGGGSVASGENIVDISRPLTLSFEARRVAIMKSHTAKVESSLSGLFSRNINGEPHGPVPNIYTPPPSSRRLEVEAAKQSARVQMIQSDRAVPKDVIIAPPHMPQLHGKKVPKDFLPSCLRLDVGEGKMQTEQRAAERHTKIIGDVPFK